MWWPGKRAQNDFTDEIRAHIQMETDRLQAEGLSEAEARALAQREFGNVTSAEEQFYEGGRVSAAIDGAVRDIRYGVRVLLKTPGFTLISVLSLALGIGANVAIFQLVDTVRLQTLPVKKPQELAAVQLTDMSDVRGSRSRDNSVTYPIWEQIRNRQQVFSSVFAWANTRFNLSPSGEVQFVRGLMVSGDFFAALGVQPVAGRVFTDTDDRRGCGFPGAVISYDFWQRQYNGQASAIGRTLNVDTHPVAIIGVSPSNFFGLDVGQNFDVALPLCSNEAMTGVNPLETGTQWWLTVMGRLKTGTSLEASSAYFQSVSPAIFETSLPVRYPPVSIKKYLGLRLVSVAAGSGISGVRDQYSQSLWLLLGIAGVVLLIACANLANLMLARSSAREKEIAVRLAIGASRGRVVRQLVTESLLLAAAGAGLGLLLARGLSRLLVSLFSTLGDSLFLDLQQDWRVLGFAAGLAILTCLLFGLTPALRASRGGPGGSLKAASRGLTASRERFGLRRTLVVLQVALSLMLVVDALLFVRTLSNLATADTGFQQDGILIASVGLRRLETPPADLAEFRRQLVERVQAIPGVAAASDAESIPVSGGGISNVAWMDGSEASSGKDCSRTRIGNSYFDTLKTPLLAGRTFNTRDTFGSPRVAVVNETFARQIGGGPNPIGKRFWIEATPTEPATVYEIVGLVRNTKYWQLREEFQPIIFLPMSQDPAPAMGDNILVRSNLPLDSIAGALRQILTEADPGIRFTFRVFQTQIRESLLRERLMATLSSSFGLLAGILAAIGLYGVMSYIVAQRKNEIGIRMALGADRRRIVRMVLRESGLLMAFGLGAGVILSMASGTALRTFMFGVKAYDGMTLLAACAGLAAVALAASYLPARRAARVEPMAALRKE